MLKTTLTKTHLGLAQQPLNTIFSKTSRDIKIFYIIIFIVYYEHLEMQEMFFYDIYTFEILKLIIRCKLAIDGWRPLVMCFCVVSNSSSALFSVRAKYTSC